MSFSAEWDAWHAARPRRYGFSPEFLHFVDRNVTEAKRVLELGAGGFGNFSFLSQRFGEYFAIEGSEIACDSFLEVHPELADNVACCDFTKGIPFDGEFDLIVDRASVPHNDRPGIDRCADLIYDALMPSGLFVAGDWFSVNHSEYLRGGMPKDGTVQSFSDGQFAGAGTTHFSDERELADIFWRFDRLFLQERAERRPGPGPFCETPQRIPWISDAYATSDYISAVWDFICRKPRTLV